MSSDVVFGSRPEPPFVVRIWKRFFWLRCWMRELSVVSGERHKMLEKFLVLLGSMNGFHLAPSPSMVFFRVELGSVQTIGRCHDDWCPSGVQKRQYLTCIILPNILLDETQHDIGCDATPLSKSGQTKVKLGIPFSRSVIILVMAGILALQRTSCNKMNQMIQERPYIPTVCR